MKTQIQSLHHVTATVDDAREDVEFYTGVLGLRLIKKTVNFDNTGVYHLYYGNAVGTPGTIMTTFPYKDMGVRSGVKGAGQVTRTSFSVPRGTFDFWKDRLAGRGVAVSEEGERFGEHFIAFEDPSALVIELIGSDHDGRTPWHTDEVPASAAIRGIHSVTLDIRDLEATHRLLEDVLGFTVGGEEDGRTRIAVGDGGPGQTLDVRHLPHGPRAVNGIGTVHHVALSTGSGDEQLALRETLIERGFQVTDVRDRRYFRSIYFREPGGVLLEIATTGPGFTVDEDESSLGRALSLPPWEEPNRAAIEAGLPPVTA